VNQNTPITIIAVQELSCLSTAPRSTANTTLPHVFDAQLDKVSWLAACHPHLPCLACVLARDLSCICTKKLPDLHPLYHFPGKKGSMALTKHEKSPLRIGAMISSLLNQSLLCQSQALKVASRPITSATRVPLLLITNPMPNQAMPDIIVESSR
jgi:hypothetical protein